MAGTTGPTDPEVTMIRRIAPALVPIILSALILLAAVLMAPSHTAPAMADPTAPVPSDGGTATVSPSDSGDGATDAPEALPPLPTGEAEAPAVAVSPEVPATGIDPESGEYVGPTEDDNSLAGDGAETTDPAPVTVAPEADTDSVPVDDDTETEDDTETTVPGGVNVSITYGPNGEAESVELTDAEGNDVPVGSIAESWGE